MNFILLKNHYNYSIMISVEGISRLADEKFFFKGYYLGLITSTHILNPRQNSSIKKYAPIVKKSKITTTAAMIINDSANFSSENDKFRVKTNHITNPVRESIIDSMMTMAVNMTLLLLTDLVNYSQVLSFLCISKSYRIWLLHISQSIVCYPI